jgi:DNA invertase Pin-like site-specific DNA recombinase
MKAAIYCRISLDATGEELGVSRQLEDCKGLVASLGWDVLEVYVDNDISASSGKPRPQYRAMIEAIKAGEVEAIIAWHPDRLYRKLRDLEELIEVAESNRITIRTVRAGEFDLGTPTGKMLARILASVSAGEGDIKADRWRRSIRQRRERGDLWRMGPRLYGYAPDGSLVLDEVEHVKALVDDILDGVGVLTAAKRMNERGARSTLGNDWTRASLVKYLRNGRIAGRSILNGEVVARGEWPAILDEETFEQVQQALGARRGTVPARPRVSLLVGVVTCGKCGKRLVTSSRAPAAGTTDRIRTYRCSTMPTALEKPGCGGIVVTAEPVEELVESFARQRASDPRVIARLEALATESASNVAEVVTLEQRLIELEQQLDEPGVPVAAIVRAMDRTRERISELIATAPEPIVKINGGKWPHDLQRRARLVRSVVDRVVIHPRTTNRGAFDEERVEIIPR